MLTVSGRDRSAVDLEEGDWVRVTEDVVSAGINLKGLSPVAPGCARKRCTHLRVEERVDVHCLHQGCKDKSSTHGKSAK